MSSSTSCPRHASVLELPNQRAVMLVKPHTGSPVECDTDEERLRYDKANERKRRPRGRGATRITRQGLG